MVLQTRTHEVSAVTRVEHPGFAYGFFAPTDLVLAQKAQTGNWKTVFTNPNAPCIVQLERSSQGWHLGVTEPSQSLKCFTVKLGSIEEILTPPSGIRAGGSLQVDLQ